MRPATVIVPSASLSVSLAYLAWVRPWLLSWGATEAEVKSAMPGDDRAPHPMLEATRALTIAAPPDRVWPWIVQMGYGRGGFYAIDIVDNNGQPSADRLVPELQGLAVGDSMPTSPIGGFEIVLMRAPHEMAMTFDADGLPGVSMQGVVSMRLTEQDGETRLVCRVLADFGDNVASRLYYLLFEPGDFVMMRLMMLGIKERAERTSAADLERLNAS